jgi:hypothetical protein
VKRLTTKKESNIWLKLYSCWALRRGKESLGLEGEDQGFKKRKTTYGKR